MLDMDRNGAVHVHKVDQTYLQIGFSVLGALFLKRFDKFVSLRQIVTIPTNTSRADLVQGDGIGRMRQCSSTQHR